MAETVADGPQCSLEVVCRSHSADNEPRAAPCRPKNNINLAKVHPAPPNENEIKGGGTVLTDKRQPSFNHVHIAAIAGGARVPEDCQGVQSRQESASVFAMLHQPRHPRARWKQRIGAFLDGIPFTMISIVFTIMILYMDLIRAAAAPLSADKYFLAWTIFAITAFCIEIIVSSLARPVYFLKFYFWMDLLASFSLLCDIPGFMDAITGSKNGSNHHVTLQRAAKAAQAGARAARIMQVIAVIQLLRYKAKRRALRIRRSSARTTDDGSRSVGETDNDGYGAVQISKPQSRIGEKVTEMTMRKVILGVLVLLLVLPVFDANVYYGHPTYLEDGGLVMLHDLAGQESVNSPAFQSAVQGYIQENQYKLGSRETGFLYKLMIRNVTLVDNYDSSLRLEERETSTIQTAQCNNGPWQECFISEAWVDVKWTIRMQALLDIGRVTFLLTVLSIGALLFIRDTDELVLQPIERMVDRVKSVSENPLAAQSMVTAAGKSGSSGKQLETRVLENSISKICSLLSVGFGEAGAEVIADNIRSGGDLNPMVPGRKVRAIFGFCDIRAFTDTTEVLQEGVMEFVNTIAGIVHTEVALHGGAANKNIGDAFLLVWKLPEVSTSTRSAVSQNVDDSRRESFSGLKAKGGGGGGDVVTHLADAALAAFIIVQAVLKRSKKLHEYQKREDLNNRMPGFSVKMGFGLHVGWAIEGAIGSQYKIDASYLSPHVNMASRLEGATKQFGVTILLSDAFVALLSPSVRKIVRQIDCVTVKGSNQPVSLYTVDVDPNAVVSRSPELPATHGEAETEKESAVTSPVQATRPPTTASNNKQQLSSGPCDHVTYSDYPYFDEFEEHPDIVATLHKDEAFQTRFAEGFEAYKSGDWKRAGAIFQETRTMRRGSAGDVLVDGPSEALVGVIQAAGGVAPHTWQGFRELNEK